MEQELLEKIDQLSARIGKLESSSSGTAERVFLFIEQEFGINGMDLMNSERTRHIAAIRKFTYWLLHYQELFSSTQIGEMFNRKHCTILDGLSRMNDVFYFEKAKPEEQREFTNLVKKWEGMQ